MEPQESPRSPVPVAPDSRWLLAAIRKGDWAADSLRVVVRNGLDLDIFHQMRLALRLARLAVCVNSAKTKREKGGHRKMRVALQVAGC
jgi:hypothetical protein